MRFWAQFQHPEGGLAKCRRLSSGFIPKPLQRFQGDGETGVSLAVHANGLESVYHPEAAVQHEVPPSRLDTEYFVQRGFYQGIADSYTFIREKAMTRGNGRFVSHRRPVTSLLGSVVAVRYKARCVTGSNVLTSRAITFTNARSVVIRFCSIGSCGRTTGITGCRGVGERMPSDQGST